MKQDAFFDMQFPTLMITDDLLKSVTAYKDVCDLFIEGAHHRNLNDTCLLPDIFYNYESKPSISGPSNTFPADQNDAFVKCRFI